jgi:hypothetical protein
MSFQTHFLVFEFVTIQTIEVLLAKFGGGFGSLSTPPSLGIWARLVHNLCLSLGGYAKEALRLV